jgi:hypothetical protein
MTDLFYEALVSHDGRMSLGMAKSTVGSFRSLLKGMDTSQYMVPARKLYDTTAIHILCPVEDMHELRSILPEKKKKFRIAKTKRKQRFAPSKKVFKLKKL